MTYFICGVVLGFMLGLGVGVVIMCGHYIVMEDIKGEEK